METKDMETKENNLIEKLINKLEDVNRLLIEAELRPIQTDRFQPTGFPDLGPAIYERADGTQMLLVESPQSVANRLELACCKEDGQTLLDELEGLPYVVCYREEDESRILTTSYIEAHRLSSPYIIDDQDVLNRFKQEFDLNDNYPVNNPHIAKVVFKYDPCSLLHGVWFTKSEILNGQVRFTRLLSGFIEAENVKPVESGGVKFDRVPKGNRPAQGGEDDSSGATKGAEAGYGNVPFHRTEYTAERIRAFFNLDLSLMRSYLLEDSQERLLVLLSLFKVLRFLERGLRLRTACDLEVKGYPRMALKKGGIESEEETYVDLKVTSDDILQPLREAIDVCLNNGLLVSELLKAEVPNIPKKKGKTEKIEANSSQS